MKQIVVKDNINMLHKIETIEKEVKDLKLSLLKKLTPTKKRLIKLRGILKDIEITDEDIASAKKSLYSKMGL